MKNLSKKIQDRFKEMTATGKLFRVELSGAEVWDLYLKGFNGDAIFRDPESGVHNCNHCNNFIRRYGNVVAINEHMETISIFDVDTTEEYQNSMNTMNERIVSSKIVNVFFETFAELHSLPYEVCKANSAVFRLGISENFKEYSKEEAEKFGVVKEGEVKVFNHFYLDLPSAFVKNGKDSVDTIMEKYRSDKEVFTKGLETISYDTLSTVKELITQGSILNGDPYLTKITKMMSLAAEYAHVKQEAKDNWCWVNSYEFLFAKFKNELIGVLCTDLASGVSLEKACLDWNKRVDPANFMKATAPITGNQIKMAEDFIIENGYVESFDRRLAVLDDIDVSEIKHVNIGDGKIPSVSLFKDIKATKVSANKKDFSNVQEFSIEEFMESILPKCTSVQAYLENSHNKSMVSLTTANVKESKPIFKWDNNYSWTFNGNLAGKSQIKEAVKARGGNTEGVVNIRMAFPNTTSDYDLHMLEPNGYSIGYNNVRIPSRTTGMLDLDAQGVDGHQIPERRVENIAYTDKSKMIDGNYLISVNDYSRTNFPADFTMEIEIEGDVSVFEVKGRTGTSNLSLFNLKLKNGVFTLTPSESIKLISSNTLSKTIYGLETNMFHKVNLMCLSPNHWGDNAFGNKHYLFMLDKCATDQSTRTFHNENLNQELLSHKKVLEVLGSTRTVVPTENQLSGIGFNSTVRDEVFLKIEGESSRIIKVKF